MKPKNELILRIINLIIILSLCIAIYLNGQQLDCEKCVLTLTTNKPTVDSASYTREVLKIEVVDLFNSIKEDKCVLRWDKINGWMYQKVILYG